MTTEYKMSGAQAVAVMLLLPFGMAWSAFVFVKLWLWFALPLGLPVLGFTQMLGARFLWAIWSYRRDPITSDKDLYDRMATPLTLPLISLGMGWILHLLIH